MRNLFLLIGHLILVSSQTCNSNDFVVQKNGNQWLSIKGDTGKATLQSVSVKDGIQAKRVDLQGLDPTSYSTGISQSVGTQFGSYSSLGVIGSSPIVSFYDITNQDLLIALCVDITCSSYSTSVIDYVGDVGSWNSLAVFGNYTYVSYYDATQQVLKLAVCFDVLCTSFRTFVIDSGAVGNVTHDVGVSTSLTIGADGFPLIAYIDNTVGSLKVAYCGDALCSNVNITVIDTNAAWPSIATVASFGLIGYYSKVTADLKAARCSSLTCSTFTLSTLDSAGDVGAFTSITKSPLDGLGVISYYDATNNNIKIAKCANQNCGSAATAIIPYPFAKYSSAKYSLGNTLVIAFTNDVNGTLNVVQCNNDACSTPSKVLVDTIGTGQAFFSSTLGSDGLLIVSYFSRLNNKLKFARCSDVSCSSSATTTFSNSLDYLQLSRGSKTLVSISQTDASFAQNVNVGDVLQAGQYLRRCEGGTVNGRWSFNNHCYMIFITKKTYQDSMFDCSRRGAYLTSLTSIMENQFVFSLATQTGGTDFWIGYTDAIKEGEFRWVNGEIAPIGDNTVFTNWNPGEPNNSLEEDCAQMVTAGLWNDLSCNATSANGNPNTHSFICERDF